MTSQRRKRDEPYPPLDDYGLIGDCHTAALVSCHGSIDWCCLPRLDSPSVFGRLLDWGRGGHCRLGPVAKEYDVARRYRRRTMVLETTFEVESGRARLIDFFPMRKGGQTRPYRRVVRIVEGLEGHVPLCLEIAPRYEYGVAEPWVRRHGQGFMLIGGSSGLVVASDLELKRDGPDRIGASVDLGRGDRRRLILQYHSAEHLYPGEPPQLDTDDADRHLEETEAWWRSWASQVRVPGLEPRVLRSALVLKTLTHAPTGAIAAAATTSMPESPGGERNWDYRFTWIRDAAFALRSLTALGFSREAQGFRRFIERTAAGRPRELQIMYGLGGEHRLPEVELPELEGYRGAAPVRVGNAAHRQRQLDIYGELVDLEAESLRSGAPPSEDYWAFLVEVIDQVAEIWDEPDQGIWEMRREPQHFVHSKVYAWVALDEGLSMADALGWDAPRERWTAARDAIRRTVDERGVDPERGVFVQTLDGQALDASLLHLPMVGYVAYDDPRMLRTARAIYDELRTDGLVRRYLTPDGLPGREGAFLPCTFWLAECLARQGDLERAHEVFRQACSTANELGLFAEEYDPVARVPLGNYPQGLTHYAHLTAALALGEEREEGGASD